MIRGNSGCELKVISDDRIVKCSSGVDYSDRLRAQCEKQKKFNQINKVDDISAPVVFKTSDRKGLFCFEMEYYRVSDYISYLNACDKSHIDGLIGKLILLIEQYENLCEYRKVSFDLVEAKFFSSLSKLKQKTHNKFLTRIFNSLRTGDLEIPLGVCHGDLTFSNILFCEDEIKLIDFLDSFIESPIQDMVKLRQDTYYNWSMQLIDLNYDEVKMRIIMKYIDNKLEKFFCTKKYYVKYYRLFQFVNLIRVLPYCTDKKLFKFLLVRIERSYL